MVAKLTPLTGAAAGLRTSDFGWLGFCRVVCLPLRLKKSEVVTDQQGMFNAESGFAPTRLSVVVVVRAQRALWQDKKAPTSTGLESPDRL